MDGLDLLKIAAGITLAAIIIGALTHMYRVHQAKLAIELLNESIQKTTQSLTQQIPREPSIIRVETPEERELKRQTAQRAIENQRHCDFWKIQTESERRIEKLKEYCH